MAKKVSKRPRTIFDESEDQKDRYLALSFQEILSDIKEYGFARSSGDYLSRDISAFIHLYRQYREYEYRYVTINYQSTGERKTLNVAVKSWMDLGELKGKLAPWFSKHQKYKEAAELFARMEPRLSRFPSGWGVRGKKIYDEKGYAFMAAAGYGLIGRLVRAKNESYRSPSERMITLARTLKQQFSREGFSAPQFLDSLSSQNNKSTAISNRDIAGAVAWKLSEFFLFEGARPGRLNPSVIMLLAKFADASILLRTAQRITKKLASP